MHPRIGAALLALSLLCCEGKNPSQPPAVAVAPTLVIRNVRVFDGQRVFGPTTVSVLGDTIAAIGEPPTDLTGIEIVDGTGQTLLPGLIDAHTHIHGPDALRQALVFGVTTELDMFTTPAVLRGLRKIVARQDDLADFRSSSVLATAPGGHGTEYGQAIPTLTRPEQAPDFVAARLSEGADYIKIVFDDGSGFGARIPTLDDPTLRALIAATHAKQRLAVVHVSSRREAAAAIEAGADGLAHLFLDAPADPELVARARERGIFILDTLPVIHSLCAPEHGAALAKDPDLAAALRPMDVQALARSFPAGATRPACTNVLASARAFHAAGVPLLASTDAPNPGTVHGASLHEGLALLVSAGLTPTEALISATSMPARAFKLGDRGLVAPGKRADLLLVRGDPTRDITATRAIVAVWRGGKRLDRQAWLDSVARLHAEVAALRAAPPPPGSTSGKISDFEAGQMLVEFGAGWQPATDERIGGSSTVTLTVVKPGVADSKHALRMTGVVAQSSAPALWGGAIFFPGASPLAPANLGGFARVSFWARSDAAAKLTVMAFASQAGAMPGRQEVTVGPKWTRHTLALADFIGIERHDLAGLFFGATSPGPFALELDDLRLE